MPGNFFDSNVPLYVASGDPVKADRAERLIGDGGMISVQVLNEITNVVRRKMGMS
jgi:predicted nucleic acid-binding protein